MNRVVIFGNSGSGKSTYAKHLSSKLACSHMDLDMVAWKADEKTPIRRSLESSSLEILDFVKAEKNWVIEGCYADLLQVALVHATEIVFLNPGTATCIDNARNRPWESHKYVSPEAQDANLGMLIGWIKQYDQRTDEFSYTAHRRLFEEFAGQKRELNFNEDLLPS